MSWFRKRFAAIEAPDDVVTEVRSVFTLFLLRMLGPFFAISFLASLSRISFRAYMAGTILGAIVANYLLLVFTESLLDLRNVGDLTSWDIAVPLLLFLIVVALPYILLRLLAGGDNGDGDDGEADGDEADSGAATGSPAETPGSQARLSGTKVVKGTQTTTEPEGTDPTGLRELNS